MDYMVLYSSKTGNTKKVATEIFSALPGMSKDMQSIDEYRGKEADTFFIGFWVNRGTCDISVIDAMSELHGRKIALFGTCGMSSDAQYYRDIEKIVNIWECFFVRGRCRCRFGRIMRLPGKIPGRKHAARSCSRILTRLCSTRMMRIWRRRELL